MTGAERDTLIALVEQGPLWDGDVPSKCGRDGLLDKGFAVRIVVRGEDGWQAATYAGRDAYKALYPGPDGAAEQVKEASAERLASARARVEALCVVPDGWRLVPAEPTGEMVKAVMAMGFCPRCEWRPCECGERYDD